MKTNRMIQLAAGVLLLTACTSDFYEEYVNGRVPVNLGYEVLTAEESTRTAASTILNDANIASGRTVRVRISTNSGTSYTNYDYTTAAAGAMSPPSTKPYYPASGSVKIVAYHPSTAGTSFSINTNQTTDANYNASDLMFSDNLSSQSKTTSTVNLKFTHKLAKLVVTAKAGDGVNYIQSVTLKQVKPTVTFDQSTGSVGSATGTAGNVSVFTGVASGTTTATGAAVIPAQTITGNLLEIVTDQGTATYNVGNSGKTFNANTRYTITVTVNRTDVGVTNSITWGSSASLTIQPTVTETRYVATPVGAIPGLFTINADGDQVFFSKGNLQATYNGSSWTWSFATNQWDYIGNATGNTKVTKSSPFISVNATVDLFGWVGASSTWTGVAQYGITSSTSTNATNGYGNSATEALKSDWGNLPISNGGNATNSGWFTLTSDEWTYVFNTRSTTSGIRYAKATVNGKSGVILLPDDWSTSYHSLSSTNTKDADYTTNSITSSEWASDFEAHGAVFLPAAGNRGGTAVSSYVGSLGNYWSSSPYTSNVDNAYHVQFYSDNLNLANSSGRLYGRSVRLVRPAWYKEMSSATADDLGKIICSNGHIHEAGSVPSGCTARAIIAYVGSVPGYFDTFLAIALEDASSSAAVWSTQMSAANTWAQSHAVTMGGTIYNSCSTSAYDQVISANTGTTSKPKSSGAVKGWRVPSVTDWKYIFAGIGGKAVDNSAVIDGIVYGTSTTSGDSDGSHRALLNKWCGQAWNATTAPQAVQSSYYWSSSERAENTGSAWYYGFKGSKFYWGGKTNGNLYVRACFAY